MSIRHPRLVLGDGLGDLAVEVTMSAVAEEAESSHGTRSFRCCAQNGWVGTRLTAREKVARDAAIVRDRASGFTWWRIAERHGISERQAQSVWKEWLAARDAADPDSLAWAQEALVQVESVIEACAVLAETTKNDSVRLGAIKTKMAALTQRDVLLQALGVLPHDLRVLGERLEARVLSKMILAVFDEFEVPRQARRKIRELLDPERAAVNGAGPPTRQ